MTVLRIVFCILACLSVAAAVPVGIFFDVYALIPVCAALLFGFLMIAAKNGFRRPSAPPRPDFMNTDEENEKIRKNDGKNEK